MTFPIAVTAFIDRLLPTGQLGIIVLAAIGLLVIYVFNALLQVVVTYWGHMLAYGRFDASNEDIIDAVGRARLDNAIENLPNRYDTVIGERGLKLFGDQKQPLTIACIILKNPPIHIVDEATSALDTETERAIQQSLADLSVGRTTLVIAHRLAMIVNSDGILLVEGGEIVGQGSHNELLLVKNGRYKRLHSVQSASIEDIWTA